MNPDLPQRLGAIAGTFAFFIVLMGSLIFSDKGDVLLIAFRRASYALLVSIAIGLGVGVFLNARTQASASDETTSDK